MKTKLIAIGLVKPNKGQIPGVPANPRTIKDEKFQQLCNSIAALPEMMELRPIIVFPVGKLYVAIAGNQRLEGCRELKWDKVPCIMLPTDTPAKKLKEIAIKDNVASGDDDLEALSEEWDFEELKDWGFPVNLLEPDEMTELDQSDGTKNLSHMKQVRLSYSEKDYITVTEALGKIADTPEHAVWKLLELEK